MNSMSEKKNITQKFKDYLDLLKGIEKDQRKFSNFRHLMGIRPNRGYIFRSDYFEIDDEVACILSFYHKDSALDRFPSFWGVYLIPFGVLDTEVSTINFEHIEKKGEDWIRSKQVTAETVSNMNQNAQSESGTLSTKQKASKEFNELQEISRELNNGAAYLEVRDKIMIKAPSLEVLEANLLKLENYYNSEFASLNVVVNEGQQRQHLTNLFKPSLLKKSEKPFHFTSTEYAGKYNLVTHGISDERGEYVGEMIGDFNNSAVLFDVNGFRNSVVVASDRRINFNGTSQRLSDVWGSKISQSVLMNGNKVVHLLLDGVNMDEIGARLPRSTAFIDMNKGDVNMFEMFGDKEDELMIFSSHLEKIALMSEQLFDQEKRDRAIIKSMLHDVLQEFYISQNMWHPNAGSNRNKLRIVGLNHREVPTLSIFNIYLRERAKELATSGISDENKQYAITTLEAIYRNLSVSNGDLFDKTTNSSIDTASDKPRVIYDFSKLASRGKHIVMAQFINIFSFACQNLKRGDTLIIHGTENIDPSIHDYVTSQIKFLRDRGGRFVLLYNSIDNMLDNKSFNKFDNCDYTIFGSLTDNQVAKYQEEIKQALSKDLQALVTQKRILSYIRRGFENVIFTPDFQLVPEDDKAIHESRRW